MKKIIEKLNKITLKYGFVFEFICAIIFSFAALKFIIYSNYYAHKSYINLALMIFTGICIAYIMILNTIKNKDKLERLFVSYIIPIGAVFTIFMIPGFVADEPAHMYRAYDISNGTIITPIDENGNSSTTIPKDLDLNDREKFNSYKILLDRLNKTTDYTDTEEVWSPAQGYNFIMYVFSSAAFLIGRLTGLNIFYTIYLARILNFIFFVIMGYYAIKKLPFAKFVFFVYLFNPMLIHQAASVSADSIINTVTLYFIASTMNLMFKKDEINKKEKIIYFITALIVSVAKYVYFPLVVLSLLLMKKKNKKGKYLVVSLIVISLLFAGASFVIGNRYKGPETASEVVSNINAAGQVKFIITHPIQYIKVIGNTIIQFSEYYFNGFNGRYLGWLNIFVNPLPVCLYAVLLGLTILFEKNEIDLKLIQRLFFIGIFVLIALLIFTGMYMSCSDVGADGILGVQGRYFIPIVILLMIALIKNGKYIEYKYTTQVYTILLLLCVNLPVIITIKNFFVR